MLTRVPDRVIGITDTQTTLRATYVGKGSIYAYALQANHAVSQRSLHYTWRSFVIGKSEKERKGIEIDRCILYCILFVYIYARAAVFLCCY